MVSVCSFLFSCLFRSNVRKGCFHQSDFHHWHGNFLKKPFRKLLDHNYIKVLFNNYKAHLQQHVERHPTVEDFTDMDQDMCWFFHQETKINEGALKIITCKKCNPIFQRTLHRNSWYFTCYYTLLFLSNRPSF